MEVHESGRALPIQSTTRLGPAAGVFLPLALGALVFAWALGGVALLFASLMLSTLACAWLFGRRNLNGLQARVVRAERRTVGEGLLLELELRRTSPGTARDLLLSTADGPSPRPGGHILCLARDVPTRVAVSHKLTRRGRAHSLGLWVSSTFPVGLLERRLRFELPADLLGLPRLGSLGDLGRLEAQGLSQAGRARAARVDEEFHALAEWRAGMSLRRVHWRTSARRGRPLVREYEVPRSESLHIVLVLAEARESAEPERSFEQAVSLAATLCEHFLRRGREVRLGFVGERYRGAPPQRGLRGWQACLEALAEVESEAATTRVDLEPIALESATRGEALVAVFAGGRRPAELLRCPAPALQIDVDDPGLDALFTRGRPFGATPRLETLGAS